MDSILIMVLGQHIKTIHKYVKDHQLALGFAYDGDGDRLLVVTK